ncbi:hypothetical protein HMPRFS0000_1366 [Staphylococcus aureus]|nr:hypothetical protein HMPRFS0000_1366 [Staphylococcus aureus]
MKNDANEKMFVLYQQLFDEFKKTNENCLLEIEQTPTSQIIINFYIITIVIKQITSCYRY